MSSSKSMVLGYWDIRGVSALSTAEPPGPGDGRRGGGAPANGPHGRAVLGAQPPSRDPSPAASLPSPRRGGDPGPAPGTRAAEGGRTAGRGADGGRGAA